MSDSKFLWLEKMRHFITSIVALVALTALPCEGKVEVLKTDTFDVATKEGFWFVEFYAPWYIQNSFTLPPLF